MVGEHTWDWANTVVMRTDKMAKERNAMAGLERNGRDLSSGWAEGEEKECLSLPAVVRTVPPSSGTKQHHTDST